MILSNLMDAILLIGGRLYASSTCFYSTCATICTQLWGYVELQNYRQHVELIPCLKSNSRTVVLSRRAMCSRSTKHIEGCAHRAFSAVAFYIEYMCPDDKILCRICFIHKDDWKFTGEAKLFVLMVQNTCFARRMCVTGSVWVTPYWVQCFYNKNTY